MAERKGTRALELWCRRLLADYEGVVIENMTTSWRNGMAFCALVHRFRPDLIDFKSLQPDNIYKNNELAFRTAETHLGIPALLDPEDMVDNEIPDRLSILTYLSQFYQRLGHTVSKCPSNNNNDEVTNCKSHLPEQPPDSTHTEIKLNKNGYEVCTACCKPVYLAQRLILSRKLFHRSCFRCGTCGAQLSPHSYYENGTDFICEPCKNAEHMSPLQDDDRMGMLMFHDEPREEPHFTPVKIDRISISDKIKLFENNSESMSITPSIHIKSKKYHDEIDGNVILTNNDIISSIHNTDTEDSKQLEETEELPSNSYKSNANKLSFLQTQLSPDSNLDLQDTSLSVTNDGPQNFKENINKIEEELDNKQDIEIKYLDEDKSEINSNIPDDDRLQEKLTEQCKINTCDNKTETNNDKESSQDESYPEVPIVIPPRRKNMQKKMNESRSTQSTQVVSLDKKLLDNYPDDLNPFSDDESEDTSSQMQKNSSTKLSTNPFDSSDDEEESDIKVTPVKVPPPRISVAPSLNPFWSDGEEPSSDDESRDSSLQASGMYNKSTITSSTPNLQSSKLRRLKPRAPRPPVTPLLEAPVIQVDSSCVDDGASLSSLSSHCSTVNSEPKPSQRLTPKSRKSRPAPTPPDNTSLLSTGSAGGRSTPLTPLALSKQLFAEDSYKDKSLDGTWRRVKGPAPGLPLPGRRVVRPELSPGELSVQLDLLETQQLGLEKQGVLLEQMIREKCEGEEAPPAAPEEVEDLVIQLCELVNEKNDLFRKQAELMYIRRQQRLEQEQADIEHEIRVIQSRPAVNRIDADKAREEQLVSRLVEVVRLRDELVQQLDYERRRERAEDEAIALSIAERRSKRNSDSNHSSIQSDEIVRTHKKSKMKDRVKKHIKKAKNTLNPKKKDSEGSSKEASGEKKEKAKWFASTKQA